MSHTTRKPRVSEVEGIVHPLSCSLIYPLTHSQLGVHYYYVTHEQITNLIEKKLFVEYARVHGNIYGTSLQAVKKVQDEGITLTWLLIQLGVH